jgi:FMN reductase
MRWSFSASRAKTLMASLETAFEPFIVGIGGTARANSTSERAVARALKFVEARGCRSRLFGGEFLARLPLYVPGQGARNQDETEFIKAIRRCDGVIICTPGYHGCISGPIKNVLDLIEDTASDDHPYLTDRAFGCIVTAYGWQACGSTLVSLRMISHALRAWPTPFGAALNASTPLFETDGTCIDLNIEKQLALVASQVVNFARWRHTAQPLDTGAEIGLQLTQ